MARITLSYAGCCVFITFSSPMNFIPRLSLVLVLNFRPGFRLSLLPLPQSHHSVEHFRRQNTKKGHHPLHESTPGGTKAIGLRLLDHLVHRHRWSFHKGILRKSGNRVRIFADLWCCRLHSLVLHARHGLRGLISRKCAVLHSTFLSRSDAHPAAHAGAVLLLRGIALTEHAHTFFHPQARRH